MKRVTACLLAGSLLAGPAAALETPPPPGPPHEFKLPAKQVVTLDNGLKITFLDYGNVPKVTLVAVVRTGAIDEGGKTWLSDLTTELMKEGTATRSAADIARSAAAMGGSLSIGAGAEQSSVGISVLSEHAADAAMLVADVLRNPALPAGQLPRIVANFERNLSVAKTEPGALAGQALASLMYGNHPFGRTMPTAAQLASYTIDDVRHFYDANFGAGRTHVYVAGRFDRGALEATLRRAFSGWRAGPPPADDPPKASTALQLEMIPRPGSPQSAVRMAVEAPGPADADYFPFTVTNTLLGGAFTSRITTNIREEKGYTYSPYSYIRAYRGSAAWVMSADIATEHTADALREIYKEIARLAATPPGEAELDSIKNFRAGLFVVGNSSPDGLLGQLAFMDLYGLPDDFLTHWVENVHAVTPAQVSEMVRQWIRPAHMSVVVVGDLDKVAGPVEALPQLEGAKRVTAP